jgi:hypothetical protein
MPLYIDSKEEIRRELIGEISGRTGDLTDFVPGSPEWLLIDAEAEYLYRMEHARAAAQLSAWVDYAGGPITEEDVRELYPPDQRDAVDLELLNSYMTEYDLEQVGELMNVDRDPGKPATGVVQLTLATPGGSVEGGTQVAALDDAGDYLRYEIVPESGERVTAKEDESTVMAPVEAVEVGEEYNVASNTVEYIPPGEETASNVTHVTNPEAMDGGVGEEPRDEYRQRVKEALTHSSAGGTAEGIVGSVQNRIGGVGVGDVRVIEYHNEQRTVTWHEKDYTVDYSADVVVYGGTEDTTTIETQDGRTIDIKVIQDLIDEKRPTGVIHVLRRPYTYAIDLQIDIAGTDADAAGAADAATNYASNLSLGENMIDTRLIQLIRNEDANVVDVELTPIINEEPHEYATGTSVYDLLSIGAEGGVGAVTGTSGGAETTFVEGTDYAVQTDSESRPSAIDFSIGGDSPDDGTEFYVTYEADGDVAVRRDEVIDPGSVSASIIGGVEEDVE